ncbi:sensor histidine kinase [Sinomicrobium sp.]
MLKLQEMGKIGKYTRLIIISLIISCLVFVFDLIMSWFSGDGTYYNTKIFLIFVLYGILLSIVNSVWAGYITAYYKRRDRSYNLFVGISGSVGLTLLFFYVIRSLHYWIETGSLMNVVHDLKNFRMVFFVALSAFLISLIIHMIYLNRLVQQRQLERQMLIAETEAARYTALKNQFDPHFLFNNLNVLSGLIEERPEAASRYLSSLSKIYRYVVEQKDKDLVDLKEELEFTQSYIALLKMRFEDGISFDMDKETLRDEGKIVSLSLQLLLENAVKHNRLSKLKPLHIRILQENGYLIVKNNKQPKNHVVKSNGWGLQSIKNRYSICTSREVIVEEREGEFTVKLPLV